MRPRRRRGRSVANCAAIRSAAPRPRTGCRRLGLNALELLANPCKTEWAVQNLNVDPTLPYDDDSFDVITNSLSCDYLTSPLEVFQEMRRVLRPGGLAAMAFTNRCFPTKVVPCWTRPFTEPAHARIVANRVEDGSRRRREGRGPSAAALVERGSRAGFVEESYRAQVASYYHFAGFEDISVADVSPDGWVGQRDPMIVVRFAARIFRTESRRRVAAATWMFRGDESRRRRGCSVER